MLAQFGKLPTASAAERPVHESFATSRKAAYQGLIGRIRNVVAEHLPSDANVLVVSKGDGELLKLSGRRTGHFPQAADGSFAGFHPADSAAVIAHLEELRAKGAEYLLLPAPAFWWLDFYGDFRCYLETAAVLVVNEDDVCRIFALGDATRVTAVSGDDGCRPTVNAPATHVSESQLRVEVAAALSRSGKTAESRAVLREGLRYDHGNPRLLLELVKFEWSCGHMALADEFVRQLDARAGNDFQVQFSLARLAWQFGQVTQVEERLTRLLERHPSDPLPLEELVKFYCSQCESGDGVSRRAAVRLAALVDNASALRQLPAELHLRISETLGAAGEIGPALVSLDIALEALDFDSGDLRAWLMQLLRPAIADPATLPLNDERALAVLLTHLGHGFAALNDEYRPSACHLLAKRASPQAYASDVNLAFAAMARGDVSAALDHLARPTRVYEDEAAQIAWPSQGGRVWPHAPFDLSAAFESLKPCDRDWPRITVVTPSLNQSLYLEETLLSVLNQHYPNLQYIVVDGGSTDGSVEILRRYESQLSQLTVEPDNGQTDALNKGLRLATGDLITWVNSDDMLGPGALFALALAHLEEDADIVAGFCCEQADRHFRLLNLPAVTQATFTVECLGDLFHYWFNGHYFYQPEVAFTRRILDKVGGQLDVTLHYTMDYDLWLRAAAAGGRVAVVHWPVGFFRKHAAQKTADIDATVIEQAQVRQRFVAPVPAPARRNSLRRRLRQAIAHDRPRVTVISTRADKMFSPDMPRELREVLRSEANVTFCTTADPTAMAEADIVVLLVHLYKEREAVRHLRESRCDVPILGWFWDNHHHVFDNRKMLADLDIAIAGHGFAADYLRDRKTLLLSSVPLCVTQWTAAEGRRFFESHGRRRRRDALYGGFVRYETAHKRNTLIGQLIAAGHSNAYFLEESDLRRYFDLSRDERFRQWASHKTSLCIPLSGDLSMRFFDALLTGQVPLVPDDVYDFDQVVPEEVQSELPVVRFRGYSLDAVTEAHARALAAFDQGGDAGIMRRHRFALENHMFSNRIRLILSSVRQFVLHSRENR